MIERRPLLPVEGVTGGWLDKPKLTLREVFAAHQGRLIDKWSHYFPIYEHHLAKFVGRPVRMLEIGVGHGGSLQMWKAYFGPTAELIGLDIDPQCEEYDEEQIQIWQGDQSKLTDSAKLDNIMHEFNNLDIVIDDGSHKASDQSHSLRLLWPRLKSGGIYIIEDCHQGYPPIWQQSDMLVYPYPWMLVIEKPKRMVIGTPSRPLNEAEQAAYGPR